MKYVVVFGALALALIFQVTQIQEWFWRLLLASCSVCFAGVAMAYAGAGPRVFLKTREGRLTLLSWLLFWPYHLLNLWALSLFRRRAKRTGDLYSEIQDHLWLGARLGEEEARRWTHFPLAVLDVAGELSENKTFRAQKHYFLVPTLDRYAPQIADLQHASRWLSERLKEGNVYVHCALGHGRSATFVAAYLLAAGKAQTVEEALKIIRRARPSIDLSQHQVSILKEFQVAAPPLH